MNYDVFYEILDYDKLHKRLDKIVSNKENKFEVVELEPIGYSSCGFPILHYSIGRGQKHIIYLAGSHGNEIIGVDFITKLMHNLAKGCGAFKDFPIDKYTIDFIPVLNPEGFYTTTYGINSLIKNYTEEELTEFCYSYFQAYKNDDEVIKNLDNLLKEIGNDFNIVEDREVILNKFWQYYHNYEYITKNNIINFWQLFVLDSKRLRVIVNDLFIKYFPNNVIRLERKHQKMLAKVNLKCIPLKDENHKNLGYKLSNIYKDGIFPLSTICNFYANSNGVNLNDNNPSYYNIFKKRLDKEKEIYAKGRENNLKKSVNGPIGMPNFDMNKPFVYEKENQALLQFFKEKSENNEYFMSFNCHSTGGYIYARPVFNEEYQKQNLEVANIYVSEIERVYEDFTKQKITYNIMPREKEMTGVGDVLREEYPYVFLIELSKMGGNPIGPYGDVKNNYYLTMVANMEALMAVLKAIGS